MERRLARGLEALLGKGASDIGGTHQIQNIPLDQIRANPRQPRKQFDDAELLELQASIEANGLLQPILVRRVVDGFELIAGERRLRACRALGHPQIPALIRTTEHDQQLVLALVENLQRRDLSAIDEALAFRQLLLDFGLTHDEIAKRVGRERSTITNTLRLLELPEEIRSDVSRGTMSAGHARALLPLVGTRRLAEALARWREDGLSVRGLEAWVRAATRGEEAETDTGTPRSTQTPAGPSPRDSVLGDFEQQLRAQWGVPVQIRKQRRGAEITFRCGTDAELDDLLTRLAHGVRPATDAGSNDTTGTEGFV